MFCVNQNLYSKILRTRSLLLGVIFKSELVKEEIKEILGKVVNFIYNGKFMCCEVKN